MKTQFNPRKNNKKKSWFSSSDCMYPPNIQHEKHKKHSWIVSPPLAPIGIRTQVSGFKVPSDNHYTIGAGWFRWESNPEPFPCKGNVITVTPRNPKYF